MTEQPDFIDDDELIIRRISNSASVKARHVKLREGEDGISCNRRLLMEPEELLKGDVAKNAWVAQVRVRDIRALGLDVVTVEVEGSPGHCEIRPGTAGLSDDDIDTRERLASLFSKKPSVT